MTSYILGKKELIEINRRDIVKMNLNDLNQVKHNPNIPRINPGDTVRVTFKIKEAARERLQNFPGLVIKIKHGNAGSFTVRRVTSGVGVEHTFPFASPLLDKVEVIRRGKVRRAKLYYIRRLSAKEARLKERREQVEEASISSTETTTASADVEPQEESSTPEEI
jgi:large subunit ribosomal protein L19